MRRTFYKKVKNKRCLRKCTNYCSRDLWELQKGKKIQNKIVNNSKLLFSFRGAWFFMAGLNSPYGNNSSDTFVCMGVSPTSSLPCQLCPCARAISLSLTFTAKLPKDHPPLYLSIWMTVPLSILAGPLREQNRKECYFLFSFTPTGHFFRYTCL